MDDYAACYADFRAAAAALGLEVALGERLARHTTYRIGGPADLYAVANDLRSLLGLYRLAVERGLPVTVLGGGSNVLISDAGIRGLVIGNAYREMRVQAEAGADERPDELPAAPGQLVAGSGAPLAGLARWSMRAGLAGLEWAVSIPGTVGGAIIGNAGAHGGETAEDVAWVLAAYPDGSKRLLRPEELGFSYRTSIFKQRLAHLAGAADDGAKAEAGAPEAAPAILAAGFDLGHGDPEQMAINAESYLAHRRATQPVEPSAGSIFRNPPGDAAGRLIEQAGLKGRSIGGAQVSLRHANFVVNNGGASAADVRRLIELVQTTVHERFGAMLAPEILFIGDWGPEPGAERVVG